MVIDSVMKKAEEGILDIFTKKKKEAKSKLHIQLIVTVVFLVFPVLKTKEETKDKCLKC